MHTDENFSLKKYILLFHLIKYVSTFFFFFYVHTEFHHRCVRICLTSPSLLLDI